MAPHAKRQFAEWSHNPGETNSSVDSCSAFVLLNEKQSDDVLLSAEPLISKHPRGTHSLSQHFVHHKFKL